MDFSNSLKKNLKNFGNFHLLISGNGKFQVARNSRNPFRTAQLTDFSLHVLQAVLEVGHLPLQIGHADPRGRPHVRHVLLDVQHLAEPRLQHLDEIVQQRRALGAGRLGVGEPIERGQPEAAGVATGVAAVHVVAQGEDELEKPSEPARAGHLPRGLQDRAHARRQLRDARRELLLVVQRAQPLLVVRHSVQGKGKVEWFWSIKWPIRVEFNPFFLDVSQYVQV